MKKELLLSVLYLVGVQVWGQEVVTSGTCGDDLVWALSKDSTVLTISGTGNMTDFGESNGKSNAPWVNFCDSIRTVVFEGAVTGIGSHAFRGFTKLTSIDIPESISKIGNNAFRGSGLVEVSVPEGVTVIEERTFQECADLVTVSLPASVTRIAGHAAFQGCGSLRSVNIPQGVAAIEGYVFNGCGSLVGIELPESVTKIDEWAFVACRSLTSIDLPDGITTIGANAFLECEGLTSIVLPKALTSLASEAFARCKGLASVTIPEHIEQLGDKAFNNCEALAMVVCLAEEVPVLGEDVFNGISDNATLMVPAGKKEAYKTSAWGEVFTTIQEIDDTTTMLFDASSAGITSYVQGRTLHIVGSDAETYVYALDGSVVYRGMNSEILLPVGVYVVKSGLYENKVVVD